MRHLCRDVNNIAGKEFSRFTAFDRIGLRLSRLDQPWIDYLAADSQRGFPSLHDEVIIEGSVDFSKPAGFTMGDADVAGPVVGQFLIRELEITRDFRRGASSGIPRALSRPNMQSQVSRDGAPFR